MSDIVCEVQHIESEYIWVGLPSPFQKEMKVIRDIFPEDVEVGSYHLMSYNGSGLGYIRPSEGPSKEKNTEITFVFSGDVDIAKIKKEMTKKYQVTIKSIKEY